MALGRNIAKAGNIFGYWKLNKLVLEDMNKRIIATLNGYKDRASRLTNESDFMGQYNIVIPFSTVSNWNQNIKIIAYEGITRSILNESESETNGWNGADDLLE